MWPALTRKKKGEKEKRKAIYKSETRDVSGPPPAPPRQRSGKHELRRCALLRSALDAASGAVGAASSDETDENEDEGLTASSDLTAESEPIAVWMRDCDERGREQQRDTRRPNSALFLKGQKRTPPSLSLSLSLFLALRRA